MCISSIYRAVYDIVYGTQRQVGLASALVVPGEWGPLQSLESAIKITVFILLTNQARRVGSDGSISASGSAGSGFNPWQGSKF